MPFADEFDDVYHIIRDAVESVRNATSGTIDCYRADDIDEPGKISDQVLNAIRSSDLVIAELTGSNPNVMYELGFAHALEKPAIILNQAVHNSPFDVKDFRQITYDRSRLLKDCRPSLIASITTVFQKSAPIPPADAALGTPLSSADVSPSQTVIRPGPGLTKKVQEIHLELRFLRDTKDKQGAVKQASALLDMLAKVSVVGAGDSASLRNAMGTAGNCAVELERLELQEWAEKIYRKLIGIFPDHEGVHIQYADLLSDLGRGDEAKEEISRARSLAPDDARLSTIETKISLGSGSFSPELGIRLRDDFYANPKDRRRASAYLMFLDKQKDTPEFEKACAAWAQADDDKYSPTRSLADHLASSRDDVLRRKAIDIYRSLQAICPPAQQAPMLHNLATLLYHFDLDDEAEAIWRKAYALDPNNDALQAAFSQLLERKGDINGARLVTRGQLLPDGKAS